jgi:predicted ATPase
VLTRLRIQGFKNLEDLEVYFGPFTCLAGPNAVGKSNVFDAIRFLNLLTQYPIMEAAARLREAEGRSTDPRSLFTSFAGFQAKEMMFTADLLLNTGVEDKFGVQAEATKSAVRYEVGFRLDESGAPVRLELTHERLVPLTNTQARGGIGFQACKPFLNAVLTGRRTTPFISTEGEGENAHISIHQDKRSGRLRKNPAARSFSTILGGTDSAEYPTVLAAKREMESWRTLMLEPSAMRAPSAFQDPREIDARGGNMAATVSRLESTEPAEGMRRTELANLLAELLEDIREIRVREDPKTETWFLEARDKNGVFHPARSLSDGTLRFLSLAILSIDPEVTGLVCLEEPENGIHPDRIGKMVRLLKDIAVDTSDAPGPDNPLRQVIINTHSPAVIQACDLANDIVYLASEVRVLNGGAGRVAVVHVPKDSWRARQRGDVRQLTFADLQGYMGMDNAERDRWRETVS